MYSVICLIGSTKYESLFRKLEEDFSLAGYLVFSPLVYTQSGNNPKCGIDKKEILDREAELKIQKSDLVFVVDQDGYIGSSTRKQLNHALLLNKPVFYYSKGDFEKLTNLS